MKKSYLAIVLVFLFSVTLTACKTEPVKAINVKTIYQEFAENKNVAKEKYGKQDVVMTGQVYKTGKTPNGKPEISFSTGDGIQKLICEFDNKDEKKISTMKQGQEVTISGQYMALMMEALLVFEKCKFVQ